MAIIPSTFTSGPMSFRGYFDTETGYTTRLDWYNTSPDTTYILQVYNETTGGRYNYRLTPTGNNTYRKIDGFISAPRAELFIRITGTVPYVAPEA